MTLPAHPGFITYFEDDREIRRVPVQQVPEQMRYAQTPDGWVPVVKVVATVHGDQRTLREFGPAGEELRSTVQLG